MPEALVAVYTSALAEDFAAANKLQPTTDQDHAFAVTNDWTSDRIAAVLLGPSAPAGASSTDTDLAERVAFMALELVIPADLDNVPFRKIIEIRERYGPEFYAFGQRVDEAAAGLATLADIRDQKILTQYIRDEVTAQFAPPLRELRGKIADVTGNAAMMSINVKTELPAATAVAGAAGLASHSLVAGTSAAAIGLIAVRRNMRQEREAALRSMPAASFLLHTENHLQPRTLLSRTLQRFRRIAGVSD